jgi:hypothetical protein
MVEFFALNRMPNTFRMVIIVSDEYHPPDYLQHDIPGLKPQVNHFC